MAAPSLAGPEVLYLTCPFAHVQVSLAPCQVCGADLVQQPEGEYCPCCGTNGIYYPNEICAGCDKKGHTLHMCPAFKGQQRTEALPDPKELQCKRDGGLPDTVVTGTEEIISGVGLLCFYRAVLSSMNRLKAVRNKPKDVALLVQRIATFFRSTGESCLPSFSALYCTELTMCLKCASASGAGAAKGTLSGLTLEQHARGSKLSMEDLADLVLQAVV